MYKLEAKMLKDGQHKAKEETMATEQRVDATIKRAEDDEVAL